MERKINRIRLFSNHNEKARWIEVQVIFSCIERLK